MILLGEVSKHIIVEQINLMAFTVLLSGNDSESLDYWRLTVCLAIIVHNFFYSSKEFYDFYNLGSEEIMLGKFWLKFSNSYDGCYTFYIHCLIKLS